MWQRFGCKNCCRWSPVETSDCHTKAASDQSTMLKRGMRSRWPSHAAKKFFVDESTRTEAKRGERDSHTRRVRQRRHPPGAERGVVLDVDHQPLPYGDESMNAVLASHVFEHLATWKECWARSIGSSGSVSFWKSTFHTERTVERRRSGTSGSCGPEWRRPSE